MKLAKCPYCGRRLSYLTAQQHKKKGEYLCSRCKKESNVYINKKIWLPFIFTLMIAIIIMVLVMIYIAEKNIFSFILVMIPFLLFYLFVPFFVTLRPLKKYREAVNLQQKLKKPDILSPITDGDLEENSPFINKDVFNQIKAKRKIITEEEEMRTKAYDEQKYGKVETETISRNLLKERTTSFSFKNNDISSNSENNRDFLEGLSDE